VGRSVETRRSIGSVLDRQEGGVMIAALGIGLIGTILVVILVIAAILFFVRRS
jgi:hypothetical protein